MARRSEWCYRVSLRRNRFLSLLILLLMFLLMLLICLLILPAAVLPVLACSMAYAQTTDSAAEDLLSKLRAFDAVLNSGFTAEGTAFAIPLFDGTENLPPVRREWTFSMMTGKTAYESRIAEVLDWKDVMAPGETPPGKPPPDTDFFLACGDYLFLDRQADYHYGFSTPPSRIPPIGMVSRPLTGADGLTTSGTLSIRKPDSHDADPDIRNILRLTGRGYSNYIEEVTSVTRRADGLLEVTARGTGDVIGEGIRWELVIDPQSAYLVRQATRFGGNPDIPEWSIRLTGQRWHDSLCTPEEYELTENWGYMTTRVSGKLSFAAAEPDIEFMKRVEEIVQLPYPVTTTVIDYRGPEETMTFVRVHDGPSSSDGADADVLLFNADLSETGDSEPTSARVEEGQDQQALTPPPASEATGPEDRTPPIVFVAAGMAALALLIGVIHGLRRRR